MTLKNIIMVVHYVDLILDLSFNVSNIVAKHINKKTMVCHLVSWHKQWYATWYHGINKLMATHWFNNIWYADVFPPYFSYFFNCIRIMLKDVTFKRKPMLS